MKILVILAHPDKESFNHAIAQAVVDQLELSGHKAFFHDLYAEGFDPLLPASEFSRDAKLPPEIDAHCWELSLAEGIVIVHPNWWGQPPAILKGWIDRVIRPDVAYQFIEGDGGEGIPVGLLKARTAVVFNTSNTPGHREDEIFGDPLESLWKDCIFKLCGVESFYRKMFRVIVTSTEDERQSWLDEVRSIVKENFSV
ncbi:MAG: NAD(P)H-dependent oxidoreductase [Desulfatibacillum sp.]|nr:NAD(P)H-dependent oxidoreductase [Desulfatibacillum sp.]